MAILQVKSIDDQLYTALGARAKRQNRSISQEVVTILRSHLAKGADDTPSPALQFLELCGTWKDEREAEEIAKEVRQARRASSERFKEEL